MSNSTVFVSIETANLDLVSGGQGPGLISREGYGNIGRHGAEIATLAGGAAAGTAMGGPGGAAAGVVGAEVANRSGVTGRIGQAVGQGLWDAGSALGEGAYNGYSWAKGKLGF